MNQKISDKNWRTTVILLHLAGILGIHRFYVGKILTGVLWLLTGGGFVAGWLVDMIMLYTGNFTDATGALVLPDYNRLLIETIRKNRGSPAPAAAASQVPRQQGEAKPAGVIKLNRLGEQDVGRLRPIKKYCAVGYAVTGGDISDLALLLVEDGEIVKRESYRHEMPSAQDVLDLFGDRMTLVGYDIRGFFPHLANMIKDIDASAVWDYIELRDFGEAESNPEPRPDGAEARAEYAIEAFRALNS